MTVRGVLILTAELMALCALSAGLSLSAVAILFPGRGGKTAAACGAFLRVPVFWMLWWLLPGRFLWLLLPLKGIATVVDGLLYRLSDRPAWRYCAGMALAAGAASGIAGALFLGMYASL